MYPAIHNSQTSGSSHFVHKFVEQINIHKFSLFFVYESIHVSQVEAVAELQVLQFVTEHVKHSPSLLAFVENGSLQVSQVPLLLHV